MKVLSLFDGISCARVALEKAGIPVEVYYASEIDKNAITISVKNYPDIVQVGSVVGLDTEQFKDIDLLIGGSPCQNLSAAGNGKGLEGDESKLFYEFVRVLEEVKPRYFILENVASMKPSERDKISEIIGVKPIMINANLVSAQDRKRYFWTNIQNITIPENKNLLLRDIIDTEDKYEDLFPRMMKKVEGTLAHKKTWGNIRTLDQKCKTLTKSGQSICNSGATNIELDNGDFKKPSPLECERLQCLPDNYTEGVSNAQRYACTGNAFNIDVVAHILSFIPNP